MELKNQDMLTAMVDGLGSRVSTSKKITVGPRVNCIMAMYTIPTMIWDYQRSVPSC